MSHFVAVRKLCTVVMLVSAWICVGAANATIARFSTTLGNVDVRLYNTATPLTVTNFLGYANANRYDTSFIHRSPPGFVVQGGGFRFTPPNIVDPIVDPNNPDPPVLNEPGISNKRGTIAMAKLGNNPNSATSQWFFNVADNSGTPAFLDTQNGGFTVFGRVILNGMSVVDDIDLLPEFDLDGGGSTFDQVPLRGTSSDTLANRIIFINSFDVLNFSPGDYNFDSIVNAADYNVWKADFGSTTKAEADGNGNGIVDAADYVIWRDTLGQIGGPGSGSAVVSAAEPSSALLVLAAGLILATRRGTSWLNLCRKRS